jgi:hypothetical protein
MSLSITFTNISGLDNLEQPQPASKLVPDWYKNMESYIDGIKRPNGDGGTNSTVKRCMPVFDAINAGYIITLPVDVYVRVKDGQQVFEWASLNVINFHPVEQALEHPLRNQYAYPKWINYWAIKTPKGYSTMFVQPMHREAVFTILPGVVDTDEYCGPVHFPFVINDSKFEGMIPKGTPIVQVIPFKRDSWAMQFGGEKERKEQELITAQLSTKFFDRYKTMFRKNKEYK